MTATTGRPGGSGPATLPTFPYVYPPRRARVIVGVLRTIVLAVALGAGFAFAFFDVSWLFVQTEASPVTAWIAALVAWAVFAGLVVADGLSVRATEAGITVRRKLTRTDIPWAAVTGIEGTITHLVVTTRGDERHELQLVSDEMRDQFAASTTPVAGLVADLEHLRRFAPQSAHGGATVRTRRGAPAADATAFLVVGAVLLAGIALLRTVLDLG